MILNPDEQQTNFDHDNGLNRGMKRDRIVRNGISRNFVYIFYTT